MAKFVKGDLKGEPKVDFFKNLLLAHPLKTLFDFFGLDAQRNQATKSYFYFIRKLLKVDEAEC